MVTSPANAVIFGITRIVGGPNTLILEECWTVPTSFVALQENNPPSSTWIPGNRIKYITYFMHTNSKKYKYNFHNKKQFI